MNITGSGIRYRNWTAIGAELLITGGVVVRNGDAEFELRLFDTVKEKMLVGKRYRGSTDDHGQVARRFCSEGGVRHHRQPWFFRFENCLCFQWYRPQGDLSVFV